MLQAACRVSIHILRTAAAISEQCLLFPVRLRWQTMFLLMVTFARTSVDCCVCVVKDAPRLGLHSAASLQRILSGLREKRAFSVCVLLSTVSNVQKT